MISSLGNVIAVGKYLTPLMEGSVIYVANLPAIIASISVNFHK
jgi:hypothetical protein